MGHTAGTLRKIGIYFILRNNWHIDVPWNISKIFYWISFFLFNTWFQCWIVWYFVKYIMQIVRTVNWWTWLAHTLCKGLIWNHKNCWTQPWLSFGILQVLRWSWEYIRYFFSVCLSVCPSVCLCLSQLFHYVPIMVSSWNFQEWLPMTEVTSMQKFKVRGQKSRLQRSKPKLAVSGP